MQPAPSPGPTQVTITAVQGVPEVQPVHADSSGDPNSGASDDSRADAGTLLAELLSTHAGTVTDDDIIVISSKVVSKAEGRAITDRSRAEVIADETVEVVAARGDLQIARTRHGLVLAAAGVDTSNVAPGTVLPLPLDPDHSARLIRASLWTLRGVRPGIIISDTAGRPWRLGQTDIAIGVAGVTPVLDLSGTSDLHGQLLHVTAPAVADEIAAAAELVMGKAAATPFAIIAGLAHLVTDDDGPGAASLIRPPAEDLFRFGSFD